MVHIGGFNPLDRGNLYQIFENRTYVKYGNKVFQSPRSGKFVSDLIFQKISLPKESIGFNPLDRGNLYQIWEIPG